MKWCWPLALHPRFHPQACWGRRRRNPFCMHKNCILFGNRRSEFYHSLICHFYIKYARSLVAVLLMVHMRHHLPAWSNEKFPSISGVTGPSFHLFCIWVRQVALLHDGPFVFLCSGLQTLHLSTTASYVCWTVLWWKGILLGKAMLSITKTWWQSEISSEHVFQLQNYSFS